MASVTRKLKFLSVFGGKASDRHVFEWNKMVHGVMRSSDLGVYKLDHIAELTCGDS